ncbi:hypothetical protein DB88DRAFT_433551 [Papiliotrema laurentii]|uniref:Gfo/Idh/MocA-like oxidoreductase N-terminal domain-containing protein n=1 Tax=Papiliotrema laurentii TaxID=5418 RepID=A0AAD9FVR8_PAPLA|nr:hypothetical protein DB88DRAFT_433551 [Papiliotrema laurentii]
MPFNLALLGSGLFATNSYLPALAKESNKEIHLHTIWSRSEKSVTTLAAKAKELGFTPRVLHGEAGLQTIWADAAIEGVSFVLPITTQPELIITALQHGKHVISEKPVGKDVEAAKQLIARYESEFKPKGLVWRVAENWEHDTLIRAAGEVLRTDKALGPVLYWQFKTEAVVIDGSSYQATSWRTIPDYQGGFLLDGGVHFAAMLRTVLPDYAVPATVISTSALHRSHIPPHDTVQGICLPAKESTTEPHGPPTALNTINDLKDIPGGTGKSAPTGSILLSWALPDTPPETRAPGGLTVTTLNGVVEITNVNRVWTLRVIPAAGSDVKPREETSPADGVERELEAFVKTVRAVQQGTEDEVQARGYPTGPLWDVAFIQALLSSGGSPVDIKQLLGN